MRLAIGQKPRRFDMLPEIKKILFPTDFSDNSRAALYWALAMARRHNAFLLMMHVIEEPAARVPYLEVYFSPEEWQNLQNRIKNQAVDNMKARLTELCEAVKSEIPECPYVADEMLVKKGNPVEKIIETAEEKQCDVIIMGSTGAAHFSGMIMGSTARRVLRRSRVPVMVVPVK